MENKKLTEITIEDAISILSKVYPLLFVNKFNENNSNNWKLINCDDIELGCKKLFNENKIYCFYFYCDSIEIDYVNEESTNNIMTYFDVKYNTEFIWWIVLPLLFGFWIFVNFKFVKNGK